MIKKPWRSKSQPKRIYPVTKPGQCVSVDQMMSLTVGFVAQLKGFLTKRRYRVPTVFVDHVSDLSYVHVQSSTGGDETIEAKHVNILHYHADNGIFSENKFMNDVRKSKQSISFCSVNAHHQNGRAEKRIRDLREVSRTQLLHAQLRWPEEVSTHLWPYALRYANYLRNRIPDKKDGSSPLERFSSATVSSNLTDFHTFGCPAYTLNARLATGAGTIPPWDSMSQLGLNLGPSPRHARNCHLILNINTGTVSPQYHVSFDEFFETVRDSAEPYSKNPSEWMRRAGFGQVATNTRNPISTPTTTTAAPSESLPVQREEPSNTPQNTTQDDSISDPNNIINNDFQRPKILFNKNLKSSTNRNRHQLQLNQQKILGKHILLI